MDVAVQKSNFSRQELKVRRSGNMIYLPLDGALPCYPASNTSPRLLPHSYEEVSNCSRFTDVADGLFFILFRNVEGGGED